MCLGASLPATVCVLGLCHARQRRFTDFNHRQARTSHCRCTPSCHLETGILQCLPSIWCFPTALRFKGSARWIHAPGWCSFDAGRWLKVLGLEGLESYAPTVVMKFTACVMVWAGVSRVPFSCSAPIVPSTSSCQAKCGCLCTHTARTLPLRPECLDWDQGLVVFVSTACQQA